jgi:Protein of unknown function (DUF3987)/RepB DNA-primase N-terminal domain
MDAGEFLAAFFGPRSKANVCLATYANDRSQSGRFPPHEIYTRDPKAVDRFLKRYDTPGRAVYFCVSTIAGKKREKSSVAEITCLHCDLDFKNINARRQEIDAVLARLPLRPSIVVASGHGLHCYWWLKSPRPPSDIDQVERDLQRLAWALAGDPQVAEISRVMRLPGSHNSKNPGEWLPVEVIHEGHIDYSLYQLESWLNRTQGPLLEPVGRERKGGNGQDADPFSLLPKPPMDVHERLAEMRFQGAGETSVHATQRDVTASMISQGMDPDEIVSCVLEHTKKLGHSWNWKREERKIRDLCVTWYAKHPDLLPAKPALWLRNDRRVGEFYIEETIAAQQSSAQHESSPDPEQQSQSFEPVDLWRQFPAPQLPKGLLPKCIEIYAFEQAELMGCDPAGLAMGALATCAATIPDSLMLKIKRNDNWKISTRLWVALVGNVSAMKTPIIRETTRALTRIDIDLAKKYAAAYIAYEKLSKEERDLTVEPVPQRLRIEDATPESVQGILQHNPDGVLLVRDELSGWFGSMEKYANRGAASDRSFWLSAYNGGPYTFDRVKRGSHVIENLSVSLLGGIQPSTIRNFADNIVDDGLIQRLIPIMLNKGKLAKDDDRPLSDMARGYDKLIEQLYHMRLNAYYGLEFSDEAQELRRQVFAQNDELAESTFINEKLLGHFGKHNGLFAQLCILWHCIEHVSETPFPLIIDGETAQRVKQFMTTYLRLHAFSFYFGTLELSDEYDRLKALCGFILSHELTEVTCREVQRGTGTLRKLKRRDIEDLFEQLEAFGWVTRIYSPRDKWKVNPRVHALYKTRAEEERKSRQAAAELFRKLQNSSQNENTSGT